METIDIRYKMDFNIKSVTIVKGRCCSFLFLILMLFISCKKPPGPGGRATVKGKVYGYDFDNTYRYVIHKGYCAGETVYICYGYNNYVGGNVKTSPDGTFQFLYLNKGHYRVFATSADTTIKAKGNNTKISVIREFDITATKQTVDLGDIVINK